MHCQGRLAGGGERATNRLECSSMIKSIGCLPSVHRLDFDEAYDLAFRLFDDDCQEGMRWFGSPNPAFDNRKPIELMHGHECDVVIAFLRKQLAKTP